jgi:hypothetical protein
VLDKNRIAVRIGGGDDSERLSRVLACAVVWDKHGDVRAMVATTTQSFTLTQKLIVLHLAVLPKCERDDRA